MQIPLIHSFKEAVDNDVERHEFKLRKSEVRKKTIHFKQKANKYIGLN